MSFLKRSFLGWWIGISFLGAVVLAVIGINVNFFPSPLWAWPTGCIALLFALPCLPRIFSEKARTIIAKSPNPAFLRKGQLVTGCLLFALLWLGWWIAFCQIGGSLFTIAEGVPHSETLDGRLSSHARGTGIVGCRYYVHFIEIPDYWGHDLCVPIRLYRSMSQHPTVHLDGVASILGFKVQSYVIDSDHGTPSIVGDGP